MKFTYSQTSNWENAFRGLRHPLESYARSDSSFGIAESDAWLDDVAIEVAQSYIDNWNDERVDPDIDIIVTKLVEKGVLNYGKHSAEYAFIGAKDMDLAQRMIKAGTPNDKFLRQIFVSVDITAPLYLWKELDTYKVGTTANSTSTMHKLASTPITPECFEMDDFNDGLIIEDDNNPTFIITINNRAGTFIDALEKLRQKYLETKDKRYWKELIRWLPESWLQTRTFTCNYAVLRNIVHWRKNHRLRYEWDSFIQWCETLPYAEELIFYNNGYDEEYKLHDLLSSK